MPKIEIENVIQPGKTYRVDQDKFEAMKAACMKVLPKSPPGLTVAQLKEKVVPLLPQALYPNGEKAGWWLKAVQLDLEAKGMVGREKSSPVRLYRNRMIKTFQEGAAK